MTTKTTVEEIRARNLREGDIIVGGYTQSGVRLEVDSVYPSTMDAMVRVEIKGLDTIHMTNSKTLKVERTIEVHEYKQGTIVEFNTGAAFVRHGDGRWRGLLTGVSAVVNDEGMAEEIRGGHAKIVREPR